MANSLLHALSSQRRFGGPFEAHAEVHDWFDRTKEAYGHFRHRAIRHCDYGVSLATRLFTPRWPDTELLNRVAVRHVEEDLGRVPELSEWLQALPTHARPFIARPEFSAADHAQEDTKRWGGNPADYLPVHIFLDEPRGWFDDPRSRAVHHHSFGCFTAERVLGPMLTLPGRKPIPTRWVAEAHVIREHGILPSLQDWLSPLKAEPWMNRVHWRPASSEELPAATASAPEAAWPAGRSPGNQLGPCA